MNGHLTDNTPVVSQTKDDISKDILVTKEGLMYRPMFSEQANRVFFSKDDYVRYVSHKKAVTLFFLILFSLVAALVFIALGFAVCGMLV